MTEQFGDDWLGCGNAEHPQECLCDVVITHPTKWANDCVNHIYMGPQICELRGYSIPWTRGQLVNYMDDLMKFQDALRGSIIKNGSPPPFRTDTSRTSMEAIRQVVAEYMNKENAKIEEILDILGISGKMFMRAITVNQFPELKLAKWTSYLLGEFQRDIEENKLGVRELMKKYDIGKSCVYNLKGYFVHVLKQNSSGFLVSTDPNQQAKARVVARRLIGEGLSNKEIVESVFHETKIHYTSGAISKLRSRNSDLG
jgi:predicted DNA-binding transcriptional regulator AlpA